MQTTYLVHFIQLPLLTLLQLAPGLSTCRGESEVGGGQSEVEGGESEEGGGRSEVGDGWSEMRGE